MLIMLIKKNKARKEDGASKMPHLVKALAALPEDLCSITETHMVKGKN